MDILKPSYSNSKIPLEKAIAITCCELYGTQRLNRVSPLEEAINSGTEQQPDIS